VTDGVYGNPLFTCFNACFWNWKNCRVLLGMGITFFGRHFDWRLLLYQIIGLCVWLVGVSFLALTGVYLSIMTQALNLRFMLAFFRNLKMALAVTRA